MEKGSALFRQSQILYHWLQAFFATASFDKNTKLQETHPVQSATKKVAFIPFEQKSMKVLLKLESLNIKNEIYGN